jgi:hypothetical protein
MLHCGVQLCSRDQTNRDALDIPSPVYPHTRSDILAFYYQPNHRIKPHRLPTLKDYVTFTWAVGDMSVSSGAELDALDRIDMSNLRCPKQHRGKSRLPTARINR